MNSQDPIVIESSKVESDLRQPNADVEARFRYSPGQRIPSNDQQAARFFFNTVTSGTNAYNSFLRKTIYYISTSTVTTTSTTSCIPAGSFAAKSSTVTCRRRRRELMNPETRETHLNSSRRPSGSYLVEQRICRLAARP